MQYLEHCEALKNSGTLVDRLKYLRSVGNVDQIREHLKNSNDYDDLRLFVLHSFSIKDKQSLLEIFNNHDLPVGLRSKAVKNWFKIETDESSIHRFMITIINDPQIPPGVKHRTLHYLHTSLNKKAKSDSFFYNLAIDLTKTKDHTEYNIDAHTLPYCSSKEQMYDLLNRWSLKRFEQIDKTSVLCSKFIRYQPEMTFDLMKNDVEFNSQYGKNLTDYLADNYQSFESLTKIKPKLSCTWTSEQLKRLEPNERFLPLCFLNQNQLILRRAPNEMIKLITEVAHHHKGKIPTNRDFYRPYRLEDLTFPRSFSIENYVELFMSLYETCRWSKNNLCELLGILNKNDWDDVMILRKQRKWFYETVVQQRIGLETFINQLKKQGKRSALNQLKFYPELSEPLAEYLLEKLDRKEVVDSSTRFDYVTFKKMTKEVFDQCLTLFKDFRSDPNKRQMFYERLFESAVNRGPDMIPQILSWISKSLTNETIQAIEEIIDKLCLHSSDLWRSSIENLNEIENIIDSGLNHLQRTTNTIHDIVKLAVNMILSVEHFSDKEKQNQVQEFSRKIILKCLLIEKSLSINYSLFNPAKVNSRRFIITIVVNDLFPTFLSNSLIDEILRLIHSLPLAWNLPEIDSFLESFFFEHLKNSTNLQKRFDFGQNEPMLKTFLKRKEKRSARLKRLVELYGRALLTSEFIMTLITLSDEHRAFVDDLLSSDKSTTLKSLIDENSPFLNTANRWLLDRKMPGLKVNVLLKGFRRLTGNQQERIAKIILHDFVKDPEVTNKEKLLSLKLLRQLKSVYPVILSSIKDLPKSNTTQEKSGRGRGSQGQSINDLVLCLPSTMDLFHHGLIEQFGLLTKMLNAANAKNISNVMFSLSRKLADPIFLKLYLEFIKSEEFSKTGITANKEILRLLIHYRHEKNLVETVIEPCWNNKPHQDLRVCLVFTILHFVEVFGDDETSPVWSILDQAKMDKYKPVVRVLFEQKKWPLDRLKQRSDKKYVRFVQRIQFEILDHHEDLEARILAWENIDYRHCDPVKLFEKAKEVSINFGKDGNSCWKWALKTVIKSVVSKLLSGDKLIELFQSIVSRRNEIDSKSNEDEYQDLPVFHRIVEWISTFESSATSLKTEHELVIRNIARSTLEFDLTLAEESTALLLNLVKTKEDFCQIMSDLSKKLDKNYFDYVTEKIVKGFRKDSSSCGSILKNLEPEENFDLVTKFLEDDWQILAWSFLRKTLEHGNFDFTRARVLLETFRQSKNFIVRDEAMHFKLKQRNDDSDSSFHDDQQTHDMESTSRSDMS